MFERELVQVHEFVVVGVDGVGVEVLEGRVVGE